MTYRIADSIKNAAAKEAVITANGRIQRLDTSYEATITPNSTNIKQKPKTSVTTTAVNDPILEDIPILVNRLGDSENDIIGKHHSLRVRFTGIIIITAVVFTLFIVTLISLFKGPQPVDSTNDGTNAKAVASASMHQLQQIENTMDSILQDDGWNNERLTILISGWEQLAAPARKDLIKTTRYELFAFHLRRELQLIQDLESGHQRVPYKANLEMLVQIMGMHTPPPKESDEAGQYQQLMHDLAEEIAEAEQSVSQSNQGRQQSERDLNQRLRIELAAPPTEITDTSKPDVANASNNVHAYSRAFTDGRIDSLLKEYMTAYNRGDLEQLLSLFNTDRLGKQRIANLKQNFQPVFKNTLSRNVAFNDFNWSAEGDIAIVNSKYRAKLQLKNNKGTQKVSAQAVIRIRAVKDTLLISSINLVNSKVNVDKPLINQSTVTKTRTTPIAEDPSSIPTPAQLQDITMQLISAYEDGDIDRFSELFTKDVKSNDRFDLVGLKQDYEKLFNTTSDRQMFIQNLKWENEKNSAKGTGDLQVLIFSNTGTTINSLGGKIQIVAQLIDNQPKITHLYHIERQK